MPDGRAGLGDLPDEVLILVFAELLEPSVFRCFYAIESFSRTCRRFNTLGKDERTLKSIAETNFPLSTKIFSSFEITPKNLVTAGMASKRCGQVLTFLKEHHGEDYFYTKHDPAAMWNVLSIGLITAEMIRARKRPDKASTYSFLMEVPWPHLVALEAVAKIVNYFSTETMEPRLRRLTEGLWDELPDPLPNVMRLSLMKSGIGLFEDLESFLDYPIERDPFLLTLHESSRIVHHNIYRISLEKFVPSDYDLSNRPDLVFGKAIQQIRANMEETSSNDDIWKAIDGSKNEVTGTIVDGKAQEILLDYLKSYWLWG